MAASAAKTTQALVGQMGKGPQFEFEDPAECWIQLVLACHEAEIFERKQKVEAMLVEARNSHWTQELWAEELAQVCDDMENEYGGPFQEQPPGDASEYPEDAHSMKD